MSITDFVKKWHKFYVINLVVGIFTFFMIISQQMLNHLDGIWHSEFALAGNWERMEGRWVWPYFDKLRFGLQTEPLCATLSIAIIVLANVLVLETFNICPTEAKAYLISFIFLVSTSVGVWLTFRYSAVTFALSYCFSVACVFILNKGVSVPKLLYKENSDDKKKEITKDILTVLLAAMCIVLAMGNYPAFFDCVCMGMLTTFILMLYKGEEVKKLTSYFVKSICTIIIGAVVYYLGVIISVNVRHLEMSDYNGAGSITVGTIIGGIPTAFGKMTYYFKKYFFDTMFRWNRLQEQWPFRIALFGIIIAVLVVGLVKTFKKNKVYGVLYIICCMLLPIAANVVIFIAPDCYLSIQMTGGLAFFIPMCMVICFEIQKSDIDYKWAKGVLIALCCIVIYGNYISTQIDQEACREGRIGTVTIAREILDILIELGYADNGGSVCFVGTPVSNERFMYTEQFYLANNLMQFGDWGTSPSAHTQTWGAIYREYLGYYVRPCSEEEYEAITARDDVAAMPMFPRSGSVKMVDGITVVKVSNNYDYPWE